MSHLVLYCAILYNQDLWRSKIYTTFLNSLDKESFIFVYDNSPIPQHETIEFSNTNIHYISNPSNPGLSTAYNDAAKYAIENNCRWIMLLDQDTSIPISVIDEFNSARNANPDVNLFVPKVKIGEQKYISPTVIKNHFTKLSKSTPTGKINLLNYTCINSGMIINVDAFMCAGGYNEKVWLDYSDHEFINRFKKINSIFYVLDTEIFQELSAVVDSPQKRLKRFEILCDCVKNCGKDTVKDHFDYLFIIVRRAFALVLFCKSLKPISILINKYLR